MIIALLVVVPIGLLLLWALYTETAPPPPPRFHVRPWDGLPSTHDVTRTDFPIVAGGYDRAAVRAHLFRVADAYSALLNARAMVAAQAERHEAYEPAPLLPGLDDDEHDAGDGEPVDADADAAEEDDRA